jgi:hypothetical protein
MFVLSTNMEINHTVLVPGTNIPTIRTTFLPSTNNTMFVLSTNMEINHTVLVPSTNIPTIRTTFVPSTNTLTTLCLYSALT